MLSHPCLFSPFTLFTFFRIEEQLRLFIRCYFIKLILAPYTSYFNSITCSTRYFRKISILKKLVVKVLNGDIGSDVFFNDLVFGPSDSLVRNWNQ